MLSFSILTFGDKLYIMPGKVDKYAVSDFEPVVNYVRTFTKDETVDIYFQHCWLRVDDADRDMTIEECQALLDTLDAQIDADTIYVEAQGKLTTKGILPEPFEDYYKLTGDMRDAYLAAKKALADADARTKAELLADGYTEEQVGYIMHYAIYCDPNEEGSTNDGNA